MSHVAARCALDTRTVPRSHSSCCQRRNCGLPPIPSEHASGVLCREQRELNEGPGIQVQLWQARPCCLYKALCITLCMPDLKALCTMLSKVTSIPAETICLAALVLTWQMSTAWRSSSHCRTASM